VSVHERHNGKWLVRFTDDRGKSRARTFEANEKRKAQDFDAEMKRRHRRHGQIVAPSEKTFSELRQDWLSSPKGQKLAPKHARSTTGSGIATNGKEGVGTIRFSQSLVARK
jgi:hypothetical protein